MRTICIWQAHGVPSVCETCACNKTPDHLKTRTQRRRDANGEDDSPDTRPRAYCHIPGCISFAVAFGYCTNHLEVYRRLTDAADQEEIKSHMDVRVQR